MREDETTDPAGEQDVGDVVVQLLRILSEVDLEELGEDLRALDRVTTQQAMTGASLLAEAITRAMLGTEGVAGVLGVDLHEAPEYVPLTRRGVPIEVHDDDSVTGTGTGSGA